MSPDELAEPSRVYQDHALELWLVNCDFAH